MALEIEQDGKHVFVYGSLMYLPVWTQVVKGVYPCMNAVADGFQRYAVPGETYPAMLPEFNARVQGLVWLNVSPEDIAQLDEFEGVEYERQEIDVVLITSAEVIKANAYIWLDKTKLNDELWNVSQFEAEGMQSFLNKHVGNWNSTGQRK